MKTQCGMDHGLLASHGEPKCGLCGANLKTQGGISEEVLFRALGVDDPPPKPWLSRTHLAKIGAIVAAMRTLGLDGDMLFERIRRDLDSGETQAARAHLNFVDELLRE